MHIIIPEMIASDHCGECLGTQVNGEHIEGHGSKAAVALSAFQTGAQRVRGLAPRTARLCFTPG
jgi:hypothetical protein